MAGALKMQDRAALVWEEQPGIITSLVWSNLLRSTAPFMVVGGDHGP